MNWTRQKMIPFLPEKLKQINFQNFFKFKFSGIMKKYKKFRPYQFVVFKKETFLLYPYEEMHSQFKLLIETFSYLVR